MNGLSAHHEALLEELGLFVDSLLVEQVRQVMYDALAAEAEVTKLRAALGNRRPPSSAALTKLHDRAHANKRHRVWRIVDWLVHSLDSVQMERDEARASLVAAEARLRAALGTVQS